MVEGETLPANDIAGEMAASLEAAQPQKDEALQALACLALIVSLLGVLGACMHVALMPRYLLSHIHRAEQDAQTIQQAAILFRAENFDAPPGTCPSLRQLVHEGYIDSAVRGLDTWGMPFRIVCDGRDGRNVRVYSAGRDGAFDTADDVNRW